MKLAALAFLTTLGLGGVAAADPAAPINPPAGPVAPRAERPRGERPRGELRQVLLERFDRNHDGRLDPQERRHAIRALRRLARRMEIQERRGEQGARREARMRELVRRYDRNGDGVVSPDEMPPGLARRLQRLDRNGDGWLDERDRP
ncbi:MAG TPA: EF-hand domain-containing protein [Kofleriaceae bacterium]|jgi:Ca2+-binding EF-hand superfamily protein|nr:EF-hand domain-containing protein [Kofleriaceae bacterium]